MIAQCTTKRLASQAGQPGLARSRAVCHDTGLAMDDEPPVSSCCLVERGRLQPLRPEGDKPSPLAVLIHGQFRGMILSPAFPCLGGSGATRRDEYRFGVYGPLGSAEATADCAHDLARFVDERPAEQHPVAVFVAAFHGPLVPDELAFEQALWKHLGGVHELDVQRSSDRPFPATPVDADDPGFFFRDRDFFVVGFHPASSRWARRFGWPILVFNALTHSTELQESGQHERMQQKILARDCELQGTVNPSLSYPQRGQFSGRTITAGWRCPADVE